MGITSNFNLELDTSDPITTMKLFLLAIALAAVSAEPESKPYYGGVLGRYGYGGYGHYLGKRSAEADSYYGGVLGGYGYGGYGHYLGKRSAEADADSLVVGYYPYGNGYAIPTYAVGYHLIGKRSAEAESKPYYGYGGLYGGYGYGGYAYGK